MVLVADRDAVSGRLLASHLARRGFRAAHTTLGREALGLARAGGLRAVVVDVDLDDMSGHLLVSQLKAVAPGLHVVMTAGDYRPELELRAREIGILHYAHKPADPRRLTAVVARAVGPARTA
jgi:DNA-binding NtrC family response regulator